MSLGSDNPTNTINPSNFYPVKFFGKDNAADLTGARNLSNPYAFLKNFFRPTVARPINPVPSNSMVAGSGIGAGGAYVSHTHFQFMPNLKLSLSEGL